METVSLKTVYQTLHDLAELGEINSLDVGTGMTRFDPNVDDPHHHLVLPRAYEEDRRRPGGQLPELAIPEGAELGFEVGSAGVAVRGLCPRAGRRGRRRRGHRRRGGWRRKAATPAAAVAG